MAFSITHKLGVSFIFEIFIQTSLNFSFQKFNYRFKKKTSFLSARNPFLPVGVSKGVTTRSMGAGEEEGQEMPPWVERGSWGVDISRSDDSFGWVHSEAKVEETEI